MKINNMYSLFAIITVMNLGLLSCQQIPSDVKAQLRLAGQNKKELLKVIKYYKETKEDKKLNAAYFLIRNMDNKYSATSEDICNRYDLLYDVVNLKCNNISRDSLDYIMKEKMDSLNIQNGPFNYEELKVTSDLQTLTSDFLINNIDHAFMVWEKPWARHITYENFCEFILPYRIHNEPVSDWREHFYSQLISLQDSVKDNSDPKQLIEKISTLIFKKWVHFNNFNSYNFYPDLIEMERYGGGTCEHRYYLFVGMCRSIGLPVSIESTIQWTTDAGGHSWNVFIDKDGKIRPINGAEDNFKFFEKNLVPLDDGNLTCTKVYRVTYSKQLDALPLLKPNNKNTPDFFMNECIKDVTGNYDFPKTTWKIDLRGRKLNNKIIYLSTFNYSIDRKIVAWAIVKNDEAIFYNIGLPAFYMPVVLLENQMIPIHAPLWLTTDERWRHEYQIPNLKETGTVKLYRKFYETEAFISFAKNMIGAKFQGSNKHDFSDAIDLFVINNQIRGFEEIKISNPQKFRYLRFYSNNSNPIRVAEIEFWGIGNDLKEKKLVGKIIGNSNKVDTENDAVFQNVFDNNIRTNLNTRPCSWVGIDLGTNNSKQVTRIGFLPRNNYNVIEKDHMYELFYYSADWVSLGKKVATNNHPLVYENVPKNAMLLLRDLTGGIQERIFSYDFDKQIQYFW